MKRLRLGGLATSILVATLSSAFGVVVLELSSILAQLIRADDVTGSSGTVELMLSIVAFVFIAIAVYVGAIVTSNTFSTIIAGRTRTIALLRLVGSSARAQRRSVAREGLAVGVIGALLGALVGIALTVAGVRIGEGTGFLPTMDYSFVDPAIALPVVAVVLTTWLASWTGSRRVLVVSPMQATGNAVEAGFESALRRRGRHAVALVLFILGMALLVLGMLVGLVTPLGVLVGVLGGLFSFTGLVLGAERIMPPALRLVGRAFGRSAAARLAAENALRYPERSSRTTIGLVIGVTLVTMFVVTVASFQVMLRAEQEAQPEVYAGTDQVLAVVVGVFSALIGFSALIAAVGMVNNLSLSVLQRTRELGLLRALGFTAAQVRRMIVVESALLVSAATLVGLALGIFYGWAGAQSLLGAMAGSPGLVLPAIPLPLLAIVVACAVVLTVAASVTPSRRATRVSPVTALGME
ncbi:MAG TPA: FtsX-like permease family protein [Terrimesophilobacter sp.]|nr:FtsX-like permease family protein [Terrimesophilobacter sp.]